MLPLSNIEQQALVDTCGTGGDASGSFNISTAAALVAAAAGARIAKHGNRAVTSACGSADVLEALGIPIHLSPTDAAQALRTHHFAFLLAPSHHPQLKAVMPVRKALGVRSILHILGPLLNPAGARRQVMGVYQSRLVPLVANAMILLDIHHAMVVHGDGGSRRNRPLRPHRNRRAPQRNRHPIHHHPGRIRPPTRPALRPSRRQRLRQRADSKEHLRRQTGPTSRRSPPQRRRRPGSKRPRQQPPRRHPTSRHHHRQRRRHPSSPRSPTNLRGSYGTSYRHRRSLPPLQRPKAPAKWYAEHLGITLSDFDGAAFQWSDEGPAGTGMTAWSAFPHDTSYFGDGPQRP